MINQFRYRWYASGDTNAFFGLLLDNMAGLVLVVSLLSGAFGMPSDFVVGSMIPGTAVGVLIGDLLYFWLAFRLAKQTGRNDVTAMPLGLDTPSIFGISLFVVGPAYLSAMSSGNDQMDAAQFAWQIGICSMIYSGIFKVCCSFFGGLVRRLIPKAGLFGSLTSIALVIISFVPLIDIMHEPIAGFAALAIVLTCLVGRVKLPFRIPGTVAALIVAGLIHYLSAPFLGKNPFGEMGVGVAFLPLGWTEVFQFGWWQQMGVAAGYLPIVLPFALATVVGGLDCTESASAVGDNYSTFSVLSIEAVATLVAGLFGGIIQTTPYIGHPSYKAMGGRAAYVLGTALAIGFVGLVGGFGYFYMLVPKAAVFPILIFVGLEISSQSFIATPRRHYPALVLACVPALAFLAFLFAEQVLGNVGIQLNNAPLADNLQQALAVWESEAVSQTAKDANRTITGSFTLRPDLKENLMVLMMLKNGFVITSLLWASILAMAIDRRMKAASCFSLIGAGMTMFGVIHSPLSSNALFVPFSLGDVTNGLTLPKELQSRVWLMAIGYLVMSMLYVGWHYFLRALPDQQPILDQEAEAS